MSSRKAFVFVCRSLGAAVLVAAAGAASAGTIAGSAHDFSGQGWAGGQVCLPCHAPHKASTTVTDAPLWNHALSTATYTPYSSPTLNATPGQPGTTSKLCLSCHDGTVAINSFGGTTGTTFIGAGDKIGVGTTSPINLQSDHPIGITYDAALVTADGSLKPTTTTVTIGSGTTTKTGAISSTMLIANKVECASCHDVHNTFTNGGKLLKITSSASAICVACHSK